MIARCSCCYGNAGGSPATHPHTPWLKKCTLLLGPESFWPSLVTHRKPEPLSVLSAPKEEIDLLSLLASGVLVLLSVWKWGGPQSACRKKKEVPRTAYSLLLPPLALSIWVGSEKRDVNSYSSAVGQRSSLTFFF